MDIVPILSEEATAPIEGAPPAVRLLEDLPLASYETPRAELYEVSVRFEDLPIIKTAATGEASSTEASSTEASKTTKPSELRGGGR